MLDLRPKRLIPFGALRQPRRVGTLGQVLITGSRSNRQRVADRLDLVLTPMVINELDHLFDRRSNSAIAKYALALRRISFAWRSSRFSHFKAFMRSAISLELPGRLPLSTSALLTQPFRVCGAQPIFAAVDMTACQRDPR